MGELRNSGNSEENSGEKLARERYIKLREF